MGNKGKGEDISRISYTLSSTAERTEDCKTGGMDDCSWAYDLVLSDALTGAKAYYLRQSLERMGYDPDNLESGTEFNLANSQEQIRVWRHVWSAGHGVGNVTDIAPMADIVERLIGEYNMASNDDQKPPDRTSQNVA